jgi:hypothetical protein
MLAGRNPVSRNIWTFARLVRFALLFVCGCVAAGAFGVGGLAARVDVPAAADGRATISLDASGGFVVAGRPTFLVALSGPPPLSGRTPAGLPGPVEIARAGVNLVRVGPRWTGWTRGELERVLAWERAAVHLGLHTWVRLNTFAATRPRWRGDAHLAAVVHALTKSRFAAGIGLWQGADEPWSRGIPARSLAFVYCRSQRAASGAPAPASRRSTATIPS